MEKVFITKKCTHRKTLHTLKSDVFELPDNKNIGKLFSKHELLHEVPWPLNKSKQHQATNEQQGLRRNDTASISLFFPKAKIRITGPAITDSLSLVVPDEIACNQNGELSNPPSP